MGRCIGSWLGRQDTRRRAVTGLWRTINRNYRLWGMRHWLPALCAACESLFDGLPSGKPFCRRLGTA